MVASPKGPRGSLRSGVGHDRGTASGIFPPVMRRGLLWWFGLSIVFPVLTIAWVVLRDRLGLPRHGGFRFVPLALALVPIVIVTPLWLLRTRSIRRDLLASGGRLCTRCGYNVAALAPSGTCPECGSRYDVEADKEQWRSVGARYGDEA